MYIRTYGTSSFYEKNCLYGGVFLVAVAIVTQFRKAGAAPSSLFLDACESAKGKYIGQTSRTPCQRCRHDPTEACSHPVSQKSRDWLLAYNYPK